VGTLSLLVFLSQLGLFFRMAMTTVQACRNFIKATTAFWVMLLSAYLPRGYKVVERKSYLVTGDGEPYVLTGTTTKKRMREEYVDSTSAKMERVDGAWMWDEIRARGILEIDLDDGDEDYD